MNAAPAVFLDRDGTLMEEVNYCADPAKVKVYPGAAEALRRLKAAGFRIFIVTNQSGIGRGIFTEDQYRVVHAELLRQLGAELIDKTYYCPDSPDAPSLRRKPAPGMIQEAAAEYGVDLSRSFVIGDKSADMECARRAGTRSILVSTGYGSQQQACSPDFRAQDLTAAIDIVLGSVR